MKGGDGREEKSERREKRGMDCVIAILSYFSHSGRIGKGEGRRDNDKAWTKWEGAPHTLFISILPC